MEVQGIIIIRLEKLKEEKTIMPALALQGLRKMGRKSTDRTDTAVQG